MARKSAVISVAITGEADQLKKAFGDAAKSSEKFRDTVDETSGKFAASMRRIGETAAGFLTAQVFQRATGAVSDFFGGAISEAADLEQSIGGVGSVFGEAEAKIFEFGKTAASTAGLSKNQVNELATATGAFLKNFGFDADAAADQTIELTQRAADMAAMFGGPVEDAMAAIQAGLRGQADPLERYGVSLTAARVEAHALAMTGKSLAKELTDEEKMLARIDLVMQQTADSAGQFASEQDTAAGAAAIAEANYKNLQAEIGTKLLPVYTKLKQIQLQVMDIVARRVIPGIEKATGAVRSFSRFLAEHRPILAAVAVALATLVVPAVLSSISAAYAQAAAWTASAIAFAAANAPLIAIAAAVAGVTAAVIWAYENVDWFRDSVDAVASFLTGTVVPAFQALWDKIAAVFGWMTNNWPTVLAILTGPIGLAVLAISRHWDTIKSGVTAVRDWIGDRLTDVVGFFTGLPGRMAAAFGNGWDFLKNTFKSVINAIIGFWNAAADKLKIDKTMPKISTPLGDIGGQRINFSMLPKVAYLAQGGIVAAPTVAVVGEGGEPEAVVPLSRASEFGFGGGGDLTININAPVYGVDHLQRVVKDALAQAARRGI